MREFKTPDLSAPRYRPEVFNLLDKQFFEEFKKKYPRYASYDTSLLKKIMKTFNKSVYNLVVESRDGVQLPELIGWLFVGTCMQSKKRNIDFAKSKQYGVEVSNNNFATDGKLAKIFYTSYALKHKMKNREYWSFVACRDFKRLVAKTYPENWNMYVIVDSNKKTKSLYRKKYMEEKHNKLAQSALKTYNEFEL